MVGVSGVEVEVSGVEVEVSGVGVVVEEVSGVVVGVSGVGVEVSGAGVVVEEVSGVVAGVAGALVGCLGLVGTWTLYLTCIHSEHSITHWDRLSAKTDRHFIHRIVHFFEGLK